MNILFLVRGYYPEQSASGNLIRYLINYLNAEHNVYVVCHSTKSSSKDWELVDGTFVWRVKIESKSKFLSFIRRNLQINYHDESIYLNTKLKIDEIEKSEIIDSYVAVTYEEALALIKTKIPVKKKNVFLLEKLPETSRIAFFRKIQKRFNFYNYRKIISHVNHLFLLPVVFNYANFSGLKKNNVSELEHPMICESNYSKSHFRFSKKKHFLYAGGLDNSQRNPKNIFLFLESFKDISVDVFFYGRYHPNSDLKNINFFGVVPKSKLINSYPYYNFLIAIGNSQRDIFPSKIFDCISSGLPFLYFSRCENDPALFYLRKYDFCCIISIDQLSFSSEYSRVLEFINRFSDKCKDFSKIESQFEQCTPSKNARELVKWL